MPLANDGDGSLTELISSLLSRIPNLLSFKSKWSSIRLKLHHLNTHLPDLPNHLSLDLLASLRETLLHAASVAARCEGPDLPDGKLKTQSDVDSITARLDRHVKDAEILIRTGTVSIPSEKKESTAARNLVIRLQIGGAESKLSAIDSLLREDDKNLMISVSQGVVPVLVRLLDSCTSQSTKEKVVSLISRISTMESSKDVLIAEGLSLLNHLLRVLESGSGFGKEKACVALQALSSLSKENARAIGCRGGISSLLEICQAGTPASQGFAAGVLRNLALFGEIKESFVEEKAVFVLVSLGSSGTVLAKENAVGCLGNLASGDEEMMVLIVREGGVKCLKSFWDSVSDDAERIEVGVVLLKNLALCSVVREVVVSEGFIPRLVPVLSCGVLGVRIAAAEAVSSLGFTSKSRREIGESGCVGALIYMLDGKAMEEKEAASKALSTLLVCTSNRKIFRKSDKGVLSLVRLLDPKITKLDKRYTVSALELLVTSKKCRKQVVAAGACLHLQKLVEMDVEGAKKLAENLARSKIWGVFARP
ncbi:ARM repeat superfamily protein [Raphanus sativus]|uniref:Vacuolar protein 8 n=1 Tax=Raphanus sativus TaxID=3726 RepID=A0A6J0MFT7_RAPSA|nr:vacuolar protein 8 [Raphanus sativus]KAJ4910001.1 ARM repeat superfamily protein [Raphanus sativus]